jgi:hypothetical protein
MEDAYAFPVIGDPSCQLDERSDSIQQMTYLCSIKSRASDNPSRSQVQQVRDEYLDGQGPFCLINQPGLVSVALVIMNSATHGPWVYSAKSSQPLPGMSQRRPNP